MLNFQIHLKLKQALKTIKIILLHNIYTYITSAILYRIMRDYIHFNKLKLDKKIKTLQSTSLYHKLRPNYDNAVFWGIIRNWRNISPHTNFLIIFLYDGFFLIFKVQEIVKVLIFLSKTSAYLACIQDMYNERWTQDLHRHPVLCIWSRSTLLGWNKIPCLLYEQLFIYTTIWFKRNILLGSKDQIMTMPFFEV
jgi:hypothetical protein